MKPIYIRTEKDGTKIFHDYTCDRCEGLGWSKAWAMTGGYCYKCGGSGQLSKPRIVKEYTPEMIAKMQAEVAQQMVETEERMRREAFANLPNEYKRMGCNSDGIGYVLSGETYPVKEQIRKSGGKWHIWAWICPVEFKADGVKAVRIDLSEYVNEYGCIEADDAIWEASRS